MHYLNSFQEIKLGHLVKTSRHPNAQRYIIKRLDTEKNQAYIVPIDGSYSGEWSSACALFFTVKDANHE